MSNTHLIWFNGTSESPEDNSHLFENINEDDYTVVSGWGTKDFKGNNLSRKTEQSLGIGSQDLSIIREEFKRLNLAKKIQNKDKVIVGGFSRGAAFFVPFFLKEIKPESCNFNKLMVFFIDPVTGTKHNKNGWLQNIAAEGSKKINQVIPKIKGYSNTVKTLEYEGLFSPKDKKESIIEKLPPKCELYGIVLCPGFEHKHKFFTQDDTFLNAFKLVGLQKLYIARMGITHGTLCSWSRNKEEKDRLRDTFRVSNNASRTPWSFPPLKLKIDDKKALALHQLDDNIQLMLKANLDIEVTKNIFELLLSNNSFNENFFDTLQDSIDATNKLVTEYKYIDYEKNDRPRVIDGTLAMKEGRREIESKSAGDLKNLLENWRK